MTIGFPPEKRSETIPLWRIHGNIHTETTVPGQSDAGVTGPEKTGMIDSIR
jgi:hypothetical protein